MSPQQTRAWLVPPDHASAREGVPLCASHADRISVPFGWTLTDERRAPKTKRRRKKAAPKPEAKLIEVEPAAGSERPGRAHEAAAPEPASEQPEASAVAEPETGPVADADRRGAEEVATPGVSAGEPAVDPDLVDPEYVPPEYQFREDGTDIVALDEPTIEMPAIGHEPATPAEVPLDADRVAAAVEEESPRLSVVPGDDDPRKTYGFSEAGQGALWHEPAPAETDPDESTPLLKRAFRVVRDD